VGYLDDVMRTDECTLCYLVKTALAECFGGELHVPISYETPKGSFRQQVALHFWRLTSGSDGVGFDIALSSADTVMMPMHHHWDLKQIGLRHAPLIRLLHDELDSLPSRPHMAAEVSYPLTSMPHKPTKLTSGRWLVKSMKPRLLLKKRGSALTIAWPVILRWCVALPTPDA
jgi:hypothetical protein